MDWLMSYIYNGLNVALNLSIVLTMTLNRDENKKNVRKEV
jgi:hypothetical protein